MNRRKRRMLRKKHVSELYKSATSGCIDSLRVLIDLQQSGRALRYYPAGRKSVDDSGVVALYLGIERDHVVARCGMPNKPILLGRDTANAWIVNMASMMHESVHTYGDSFDLYRFKRYSKECTPDFSIEVDASECGTKMVCRIDPIGCRRWIIPVTGASDFVRQAVVVAEQLGWTLSATESELDTVKIFTDGNVIGNWDVG